MGSDLFNVDGVSFGRDENVLELNRGEDSIIL